MPNWVTNKVKTTERVIRALMNEEGEIDFNRIKPFRGASLGMINLAVEDAAKQMCNIADNDNPLIASLQAMSRRKVDIRALDESSFRDLITMLENYRFTGYLHGMDFACEEWGTKWNACHSSAMPEQGECEFDTAWSCPVPLLTELALQYPDDTITVKFADEDIGNNCGTMVFKNDVVGSNCAPDWCEQDDEEKAHWKAFACEVTGYQPSEDDDE